MLFRGGMRMAQRFSAWLPRDKLLPEQQACAITILAGGPATPIQPQENVQQNTGQTSWQTAHRFYLEDDERAFSKHIS